MQKGDGCTYASEAMVLKHLVRNTHGLSLQAEGAVYQHMVHLTRVVSKNGRTIQNTFDSFMEARILSGYKLPLPELNVLPFDNLLSGLRSTQKPIYAHVDVPVVDPSTGLSDLVTHAVVVTKEISKNNIPHLVIVDPAVGRVREIPVAEFRTFYEAANDVRDFGPLGMKNVGHYISF